MATKQEEKAVEQPKAGSDGAPPGGVVAWKSLVQGRASATQLATTLVNELNVGKVDVSIPFGLDLSAIPTVPVCGSARLRAICAAFVMPYVFPIISLLCTNCANAFPVATVVRSFTTTLSGASEPVPIALASMAGPFSAITNRTRCRPPVRSFLSVIGEYSIRNWPERSVLADPIRSYRGRLPA